MTTRGFSLIEVFISGVLFLLAVAGIAGAVSTAAGVNADARLHAVAAELAEERLERLLAAAGDATELRRDVVHEERVAADGTIDAAGPFTLRWTAAPLVGVPSVSRLVLEVLWLSGTRDRSLRLETCRD